MLIVRNRRLLATAMFALVLAACTSPAARPGSGAGTAGRDARSGSAAAGGRQCLAAVRHVWVIELENRGYAQSFGTPSADPYLARMLPRMGVLLENYYAIGHNSAANYVAQVSGQSPSLGTQIDCPVWTPFPGAPGGLGQADAFLTQWVPKIMAAPAYRDSAVAGGLLGLLRLCRRHPERVTEATVDQLAEAELRLLGVPADEAARLTALPLPPIEAW
jgi:hypothetical protein